MQKRRNLHFKASNFDFVAIFDTLSMKILYLCSVKINANIAIC